MKPNDLVDAINNIVANFESGDLAGAINDARIAAEYYSNNGQVVVVVNGGNIQGVIDEEGNDIDNQVVIDFDEAEAGACPACRNRFDPPALTWDNRCPHCNYPVFLDDPRAALRALWHYRIDPKE